MRLKTSVTLPRELLERIDQEDNNRSSFLERAAVLYLRQLEKAQRDAADIDIINRNSARLNREAEDVLGYQGLG